MRKPDPQRKIRLTAGLAFWRAYGWVCPLISTVVFALYNGILGVCYGSVWHGSICLYYLLMSVLRGGLLVGEHSGDHLSIPTRQRLFRLTSASLLLMNAALTVPTALMVLDRRSVRLGLIPAIASATYTTYKITSACVKLKQTGASPLVRELSLLRLIDALVSILVLQNTLITTVDGQITERMFTLVAISSTAILFVIFALSVLWLLWGQRKYQLEKFTP